jgi:signal transduction histidine kinase
MTRRLLISYVTITLLVLVILEIPLGIAFANAERRRLESDVQHDAFALALRSEEALEHSVGTPEVPELTELAERYQRDHGGRVVIVNDQGLLVADSDPPDLGGASTTEPRDFSGRPEIARALNGRDVTGDRFSTTLGTDLLYVAVPIATGGEVHGAIRITFPLSFVNDRITDNWLILAGVAGVVLLVVSLVSIVLARSMARPLARLEQGAEALGRGELDRRVDVPNGPRELRTLARSFNATAARLEQLIGAQQDFVADASHQLRTPLSALRLRLENLGDEITPDGRDDLASAIEEVGRLSLLVDGLLALARAEEHGATPEPVDVRRVIEGRRDAWSAFAEERDVILVTSVDGEWALATPGRLEQVLDNLLNNALEVAPANSTIGVAVERRGDEVTIRVSDAGPGMTDEERKRAFDRFWRVERGTTGFGLGLAIVRQLVVADGGSIELGRSSTGGLEVALSLPAAPPGSKRRAEAELRPNRSGDGFGAGARASRSHPH